MPFHKAVPKPGQRVLVFGAGAIGLLTVQLALKEGAEVYAIDLIKAVIDFKRTWRFIRISVCG